MANIYPTVSPLRELREALSKLRLNSLTVGKDGRNRCLLSAFRARTGRNQPSSAKYLFGPSTWILGLIKPPEGHAVAYIDWSQQEFGIAAALSGDSAMMAAYRSGDPYLAFGKAVGAIPADADKSHHLREMFKQCVLGVGYGMGEKALASRIGAQTCVGRELLQHHGEAYHTFWKWIRAAVDDAMLTERIETVFGWRQHIAPDTKPRALLNFPMQANGSEMLRLACCLGTERGVEVCAPVHDAVLVAAPVGRIDDAVVEMQSCMGSRIVLDGFELGSDAKVVKFPDRYMDKRGAVMWTKVMELLKDKGGLC
jgi:DNA polymerase family A